MTLLLALLLSAGAAFADQASRRTKWVTDRSGSVSMRSVRRGLPTGCALKSGS